MRFNEEPITNLAGSLSFERVCSSESGKLCLDLIGSVSQKIHQSFQKFVYNKSNTLSSGKRSRDHLPYNFGQTAQYVFGSEIRGSYYCIVVSVRALK